MKKFMKAAAAIMLTMAMLFAIGCKPEEDPNNGGDNGGGNGGGGGTNPTELPAGMYLGVIGFNEELYTIPLTRLNASAIAEIKGFIDGLTMGGATLLYHAVNTALETLSNSGIPENLVKVSVVTFSDGLDKGSYAYSNYPSGQAYLNAVNDRILHEQVAGNRIEAWAIGFPGTDVSEFEQGEFIENMNKLASDANHVFVMDNIGQMGDVFSAIADSLKQTTINSMLKVHMPKPEPNTKVRFTLDVLTDNSSDAALSNCYIEGTFINNSSGDGVLTGLQYVGLSSSSGTVVTSVSNGIFSDFTFEGMLDSEGNPLESDATSHVKEWDFIPAGNFWRLNSEFDSDENTSITHRYYSAMVMLNLDCSRSLGDDTFAILKNLAKQFVDGLKTSE